MTTQNPKGRVASAFDRQPLLVHLCWALILLVGTVGCSGEGTSSAGYQAPSVPLDWGPIVILEDRVSLSFVGANINNSGRAVVVWGAPGNGSIAPPRSSTSMAVGSWTAPVSLESVPPTLQSFPLALIGTDLGHSALWLSEDRALDFKFRTADNTNAWSAPQTLPTSNAFGEVAMAGNRAGEVVVVWTEVDQTPNLRLVGARRRIGDPWSAASTIQPAGAIDFVGAAPEVALDAQGMAVAVWTQPGPSGTRQLFSSQLAAGTVGWSTPVRLDVGSAVAEAPQIASTGPGRFVVGWQQVNNAVSSIYAAALGPGGWQQPVLLENDNRGSAGGIVIAPGPNQSVWVTWVQSDGATRTTIASRYSGGSWSTAQPVSPYSSSLNHMWSRVAVDGQGGALVVTQVLDLTTGLAQLDYFYIKGGAGPWAGPFRLSGDPVLVGGRIGLSMNDRGSAVVSWLATSGGFVRTNARLLRR